MDNEQIIKNHIELNKYLKKPYKVILSNYTFLVESEANKIKSFNDKDLKFFIAGNKIKSDCIKKPLPIINKNELKYFEYNFNEFKKIKNNSCYGIDLKSAYPTILLNNGYISKQTHFYISKLPKLDRLGAIGMLAGSKKVFEFNENNELINNYSITNKNENYFYYCVKKVSDIMDEIKKQINSFLFFWVDCIYFADANEADKVKEILNNYNFNYHEKIMINFLYLEKKITFDEIDADGVIKKKTFFCPNKDYQYKNLIEKHIYLYHNKKSI
jgi:hypothetical protein